MEHLSAISTVVFIDISFKEMMRRLGDLTKRGVVIKDGLTIEDVYDERLPLYRAHADLTLSTGSMGTREAVEALDRLLAEHGI